MAMYPNATAHGYMPFVTPAHRRQAAKRSRMDHKEASKAKSGDLKTYKVTLRDKKGTTVTYIIQADPNSNTVPILCESMVSVAGPKPKDRFFNSLPNMESPEAKLNSLVSEPSSPESRRHYMLAQGKEDLSKLMDDSDLAKSETPAKKGIFKSLFSFIKKKTGSSNQSSSKSTLSPQVKSKRKAKPMFPKKRLRTISTASNLQTIHESPNEEEDSDSDSFTHDSSSDYSES